jgi:hypothetical protein
MSNKVFANAMEISCKAANGKTMCAFPDVCFTPPQTPATPPGVPLPYPNTGFSSDTTDGSTSVEISGQQVMLKNKSYFKRSSGDEAGCAPKKGLITSTNTGKIYFSRWSMDVLVEGENVVRHLDITTHNHSSYPGNESIPWPHLESMAPGAAKAACDKEVKREKAACKDFKKQGTKNVCAAAGMNIGIKKQRGRGADWNKMSLDAIKGKEAADKCLRARKCRLVPYNAQKDGVKGCCPSQTPDHVIPKSSFYTAAVSKGKKLPGWKKYKMSAAPCMCAEGPSNTEGSHGLRHAAHKFMGKKVGAGTTQSFAKELNLCVKSAQKVFKSSNCSNKCLKAQLNEGHKDMCSKDLKDAEVKHSPSGSDAASDAALNPLKALGQKRSR